MDIATAGIPGFARTLLRVAPEARPTGTEVCTFSLPRLRLTAYVGSAGYAGLCRRALVDRASFQREEQRGIELDIVDCASVPELAGTRLNASSIGLGQLVHGLQLHGLNGSFDVDHDIWQFFDPAAGRGVQALAAAGRFPPWEASFPLRNFLHWAYQSIGMRLMHAGTLGSGGVGILLAGTGGSGKSGTTLAGIVNGLTSVGDDYIAVSADTSGPRAYPVSRLMKQDAAGLARVGIDPVERSLGCPNWQGKYEIDYGGLSPASEVSMLALGAIVLPRLAGTERSRLRPATRHEAMMALAPSNLQQLPGAWKEGLEVSARLARTLPAYHLDLGSCPTEVAGCVADFIEARAWSR